MSRSVVGSSEPSSRPAIDQTAHHSIDDVRARARGAPSSQTADRPAPRRGRHDASVIGDALSSTRRQRRAASSSAVQAIRASDPSLRPSCADTGRYNGRGMTRANASAMTSMCTSGRCGSRSIFVISTRSALRNMTGYLSGLSSPSVTAERDDVRVLAEIVDGRAHQIADVLDEQVIAARATEGGAGRSAPSRHRGDRPSRS